MSKEIIANLIKDAVYMGKISGEDPKNTTSYAAAMLIQTMSGNAEKSDVDLIDELERLWSDMDSRHNEVPDEFVERLADIISVLGPGRNGPKKVETPNVARMLIAWNKMHDALAADNQSDPDAVMVLMDAKEELLDAANDFCEAIEVDDKSIGVTIIDALNQNEILVREVEYWKNQWDGAQKAIKRLSGITARHAPKKRR